MEILLLFFLITLNREYCVCSIYYSHKIKENYMNNPAPPSDCVFGGHMSLFWDHWYPCFGFLVTSPLGLKARVGFYLFASGATCADLFGSLQCSWSLPHMHVQRWDLAQIRMGNHPDRRRTRHHCASDPAFPVTGLYILHCT